MLERRQIMLHMLDVSKGAHGDVVPCCAMELEQDIARLEAEAEEDSDELAMFMLVDTPLETDNTHKSGSDDLSSLQDQNVSDADSDDGGEDPAGAELARITANALMFSQTGKTLQPGAWRGCCKSPWCDREDRHRGLCNHRATIPGPAACPAPASAQEEQEGKDEEDASNLDDGGFEAACSDAVMQSADEQQSSGGHSHNCQAPEAGPNGDEREVASALQTDIPLMCVHHQHSTTQVQLQQELPVAAPADQLQGSCGAEDELYGDLFWGGNNSQLAAAELFSIPTAYQPRVKDLTAPGTHCMLGLDALCNLSTPLSAPVDEPQVATAFEPSSSEHSDRTNAKLSPANSNSCSAPSSPSCVSACAATAAGAPGAVFGFCEPAVLATESDAAPSSLQAQDAPPATCSDSPAAFVAAADASVFAHVAAEAAAPAPAAAAAAASGVVSAAAVAAAAMHAESSFGLTADGADSSAQAAADQAAAEAAAAAEEAAAAAAALATSSLSGALAMPGFGALQRPPRIKSKPSNSMVKVAAILEASGSPKSKKRPAARLAMNPSSGHCCTQCGAVSTPVWRAGPAGPKTLCNACGVRYMKVAKRK